MRFLKSKPSCINSATLPFCSHCHAISKKVFKIAVAPFLPVLVKLVKNSHFYNVNLAQNLKTAITFFWDVRLSWYLHGWVCMFKLFPWIPITGILVWPVVMAIWAIYGQNGHIGPYMAHMAMTIGQTNMPVMGIQGKSLNLRTQPWRYQLIRTSQKKVMALLKFKAKFTL